MSVWAYRVCVVALCVLGCSDEKLPSEPNAGVSPDASNTECPSLVAPVDAKIFGVEFYGGQGDAAFQVAIWLTAEAARSTELCDGETGACLDDTQLLGLMNSNVEAWRCVFEGTLPDARIDRIGSVWYEPPQYTTDASTLPFLRALRANLSLDQMRDLSRHPFLDRIEPAPGFAGPTGFFPEPPLECPEPNDSVDAKLDGALSLQGQGRQPAAIQLKTGPDYLPPLPACADEADGELCPEAIEVHWARALLNKRAHTCVLRHIEQIVRAATPEVPYAQLGGDTRVPAIPPLGEGAAVVREFGFGLTWEEAGEIAKHPYVASIRTDPSLIFSMPEPGCPPDPNAPIVPPECPTETTPVDSKIEPALEQSFSTSPEEPQEVLISVIGGATICPLEECTAPPCASNDATTAYWEQQNLASQQCVRQFVQELGGETYPETQVLTNTFSARLDWAQVQEVATHPHVRHMDPASGGGVAGP